MGNQKKGSQLNSLRNIEYRFISVVKAIKATLREKKPRFFSLNQSISHVAIISKHFIGIPDKAISMFRKYFPLKAFQLVKSKLERIRIDE